MNLTKDILRLVADAIDDPATWYDFAQMSKSCGEIARQITPQKQQEFVITEYYIDRVSGTVQKWKSWERIPYLIPPPEAYELCVQSETERESAREFLVEHGHSDPTKEQITDHIMGRWLSLDGNGKMRRLYMTRQRILQNHYEFGQQLLQGKINYSQVRTINYLYPNGEVFRADEYCLSPNIHTRTIYRNELPSITTKYDDQGRITSRTEYYHY